MSRGVSIVITTPPEQQGPLIQNASVDTDHNALVVFDQEISPDTTKAQCNIFLLHGPPGSMRLANIADQAGDIVISDDRKWLSINLDDDAPHADAAPYAQYRVVEGDPILTPTDVPMHDNQTFCATIDD